MLKALDTRDIMLLAEPADESLPPSLSPPLPPLSCCEGACDVVAERCPCMLFLPLSSSGVSSDFLNIRPSDTTAVAYAPAPLPSLVVARNIACFSSAS
eukprot:249829-Chlamydomonas_euryale.AAC.5